MPCSSSALYATHFRQARRATHFVHAVRHAALARRAPASGRAAAAAAAGLCCCGRAVLLLPCMLCSPAEMRWSMLDAAMQAGSSPASALHAPPLAGRCGCLPAAAWQPDGLQPCPPLSPPAPPPASAPAPAAGPRCSGSPGGATWRVLCGLSCRRWPCCWNRATRSTRDRRLHCRVRGACAACHLAPAVAGRTTRPQPECPK